MTQNQPSTWLDRQPIVHSKTLCVLTSEDASIEASATSHFAAKGGVRLFFGAEEPRGKASREFACRLDKVKTSVATFRMMLLQISVDSR
jgi:hypothetical protein